MAILTLNHVGQSFGEVDIFSGVSGSVPNDGKIGLVGPNGVGKTTLLLMIAGLSQPSAGHIHIAKGTKLGYLPQEASQAFVGQDNNVYEEILSVFDGLRQTEARLNEIEHQMADDHSDELLDEYSQLQQTFEAMGGYDYELRINNVLTGLGFNEEDRQRPLVHLSGGQKTRLLLAKLLLEQPELLILDEPTNHLDVQAVEWLEGMLRLWPGAILLVSHDRYFLDKVVNNIWEMGRDGLELYRGNYTAYVGQREARWQKQLQAFADFSQHVDKEMDYIRRNIAGQRTQMAQGKLSRLAREVAAYQAGGLDALALIRSKGWLYVTSTLALGRIAESVSELQQQISGLQSPRRPSTLNMQFPPSHRSGELVLRSKNLAVGYAANPLFWADDVELHRQDRAALIGPNGTGKSTFLKTILDELPPVQGEYKLGASLSLAYFAQAHYQLNPENSVLDELLNRKNLPISEARSYLARFLFRGDDVYKKVSMLSGGERGRLSLALLALAEANFLLLDEPTNHLDIPSQETLQAAMAAYDGTILMVSHDRYLVDKLATQIWEVRDGRLQIYVGSYQDYLQARQQENEPSPAKRPLVVEKPTETAPTAPISKNELRRRALLLENLENDIQTAEQLIQQLSEQLQQATEAQSFDKIQNLGTAYNEAEQNLEALLVEWEKFHEEYGEGNTLPR